MQFSPVPQILWWLPNIAHKIQLGAPKSAKSRSPTATMFMRFPTHRARSVLQSPEDVTIPWAHEIVKLEYRGLVDQTKEKYVQKRFRVLAGFVQLQDGKGASDFRARVVERTKARWSWFTHAQHLNPLSTSNQ